MIMLLDGVMIVDFSQYYPGPFATLRLQDWGATVVKVENPMGDPIRYYKMNDAGEALGYKVLNRGKQSVMLNLKDADDLAKAKDLVECADVVVEGFRPGVMDRLGLGYEDVKAVNQAIVYCSVSGYGQNTPIAHVAGHDANYMAVSGVASQISGPDGRPLFPEIALGDTIAGMHASESILAGLVHKALTGEGAYFDISIAETIGLLQSMNLGDVYQEKAQGRELKQFIPWAICNYAYRTADGRYVTIEALEPKFWKTFCEYFGCQDLLDKQNTPPDESNPAFQAMEQIFASHTFAEWIELWQEVDCCLGPVYHLDEIDQSPVYAGRNDIQEKYGVMHMTTHYLDGAGIPDYEKPYRQLGDNDLGY